MSITGKTFALQHLETARARAPQLFLPQALETQEELAKALTDLLCEWTLDPRYTRIITRYIRKKLPKDAHIRVVNYLKRLRREGFLIQEEGLTHVAERKAVIALAFALDDQLPTYAPNSGAPSAREDAANALLQLAGYDRLYPRSPEDASVIFALNNHLDMHRWQTELQPICRAHAATGGNELLTLGDLRYHVRKQETPDGITLDVTGLAHQSLSTLRGGPEVFADWLAEQEETLLSFARERARLYLCRALLAALDRQVQSFLSARDAILAQRDPLYDRPLPYVRENMAELAEKLWLKGYPYSFALHLSAVLQNREMTAALTARDFDGLNLNFTRICREMTQFYVVSSDGDGALGLPGPALTGNRLKQILAGQLPISRTFLIRALAFLDGKDALFVNNRLVRAGFAPLDKVRSLDDDLICALLEHPTRRQRAEFLDEFFRELDNRELTYPCLKLSGSVWHQDFL